MYAVEVRFKNVQDDIPYTYLVHDSIKLGILSCVVVPVLENFNFKVGQVRRIIRDPVLDPEIEYRWVVQRIDFNKYRWCLENREDAYKTKDQLLNSPSRGD